ncbi:MAG: right-handed parallel beta-helix repeat-containing protein [Reichenbachiella sp.]
MKFLALIPTLSHFLLLPYLAITLFGCKDDLVAPEDTDNNLESPLTGCVDTYGTNHDETALFSDNSCTYNKVSCSSCDYVIENDEHTLNNDILGLKPGAIIGIKGGDRKPLTLLNFNGTADDGEFIFTNCDGTTVLSLEEKPEAIRIRNSSFLRFTGTGSSDKFGIEVTTGALGIHGYEKVSDIEIDHIKISNVNGIGIWIVTRPTCDGSANYGQYEQKNTKIHHNHISDVHGEGMYIGPSKWDSGFDNSDCPDTKLKQADLKGVEIFNNLVERTGWDGIQVGGAIEDCSIYKNIIRDYGLEEVGIHQAGLMINPGTVGEFYANLIEGGTGNAMHLLGFDNLVYSNLIIDCQLNAIHTGDRNPPTGQSYRIVNNTMINVGGKALNMNSKESVSNIFDNNFMSNISDKELSVTNPDNTSLSNNIMTASLEDYPFVDVAKLDFTPTQESALLDAGKIVDRNKLVVDYNMNYRLNGTNLDIGAFENQE